MSQLLKTLVAVRYVRRTEAGGLFIGPAIQELARGSNAGETLTDLSESVAWTLASEVGESVTVGLLKDGNRYNLAKATINKTVTVNASIELRQSPYGTATGRAMMAVADKSAIDAVVAKHGLPGVVWPNASTRRKLDHALTAIRQEGVARHITTDNEVESLAMPIANKRISASIGVATPRFRLTPEHRALVLEKLKIAADYLSESLALKR